MKIKFNTHQMVWASVSVSLLVLVFLFQQFNYGYFLSELMGVGLSKNQLFVLNKLIRFLINDGLSILLIYALFQERKYVIFAFYVQLVGLIFFLIPYLILKLNFAQSTVMISYLHRIIMNPTLLMLLIPAFYYQKSLQK